TIGQPHCPRTGEPTPSRSSSQILEAILSLPARAEIELRAPVFPIYGEDLDVLFTEVRRKGCRRMLIDGKPIDLAERVERDPPDDGTSDAADGDRLPAKAQFDAIVDRLIVDRRHEKAIKAGIAATLLVGDGLLQIHVASGATKADAARFYKETASATHHFIY